VAGYFACIIRMQYGSMVHVTLALRKAQQWQVWRRDDQQHVFDDYWRSCTAFAIIGGLYGFFTIVRNWTRKRSFKQAIHITCLNAEESFKSLLARRGKTVSMDTALDFSVSVGESENIWRHLRLEELFDGESLKNALRIPIVSKKLSVHSSNPVSLNSLRIVAKDPDRLRLSHGGTGVIMVPLKGTFEVGARYFSGPSTEITLREVP
jgi:hypothetical protein